MRSFFEWVKTIFFPVSETSTARVSSPSRYHGKSGPGMASELKRVGKGDMASGITAEKQNAFMQGFNIGKKSK